MLGFPGGTVINNPPANAGDTIRPRFGPWGGKIPWRKKRQPALVFFSENPMERGAWWAVVHAVAKESDTTEQLSITHTHTHTHTHRIYVTIITKLQLSVI